MLQCTHLKLKRPELLHRDALAVWPRAVVANLPARAAVVRVARLRCGAAFGVLKRAAAPDVVPSGCVLAAAADRQADREVSTKERPADSTQTSPRLAPAKPAVEMERRNASQVEQSRAAAAAVVRDLLLFALSSPGLGGRADA